jgi:hypothetical protein
LKGFAAATLYGTAGKNGVILLQPKGSKTGPRKQKYLLINLFINEIASLPDYQNSYGNGFDQAYGNWGPSY